MHDNPSAFPSGDIAAWPTSTFDPGMTLRDYFAGQALTSTMRLVTGYECKNGETMAETYARRAYEMADAMLSARKEQPNADR